MADPNSIPQREIDRFWSRVRKTEGCWLWTASTQSGYGQIMICGRTQRAHRVAWQVAYGEIPPDVFVCHRCDNKLCCNPSHLFLGTHRQNMADMRAKRRSARGERNGGAKLTTEQVIQIKALLWTQTDQAIASRFGVTRDAISKIKWKRVWAHIPDPLRRTS